MIRIAICFGNSGYMVLIWLLNNIDKKVRELVSGSKFLGSGFRAS